MISKQVAQKYLCGIGTFLCFFAVFSQYIIRLYKVDMPWYILTINHFSFFTILTNLLVGVFFMVQLLPSHNKWHLSFIKPPTAAAITVYIILVGMVYNLMLRKIYHPSGLEGINNNLLHVFIPLLMLIYWTQFIASQKISFKNILYWILYPLCYVSYILVKGYFMHFYQYPFFDVDKLGYSKVILMALNMLLGLVVLSVIVIFANNKMLAARDLAKEQ